MCDYSLENVKTCRANVGDRLFTHRFSFGTVGFAASEDIDVAVCVLPGTEWSFACEVKRSDWWPTIPYKTTVFRQINQDCPYLHHDAVEFPDGDVLLLTYLMENQEAVVLQLPAPSVASKAPQRAAHV